MLSAHGTAQCCHSHHVPMLCVSRNKIINNKLVLKGLHFKIYIVNEISFLTN